MLFFSGTILNEDGLVLVLKMCQQIFHTLSMKFLDISHNFSSESTILRILFCFLRLFSSRTLIFSVLSAAGWVRVVPAGFTSGLNVLLQVI